VAELESSLSRGEATRSVELGDNRLAAIIEFECRRVESSETEVPLVTDPVHLERPVKSERPTTSLLHDFVDVLGLVVVLEERIMEKLPLDLGNLDIVPFPLQGLLLVSVMLMSVLMTMVLMTVMLVGVVG